MLDKKTKSSKMAFSQPTIDPPPMPSPLRPLKHQLLVLKALGLPFKIADDNATAFVPKGAWFAALCAFMVVFNVTAALFETLLFYLNGATLADFAKALEERSHMGVYDISSCAVMSFTLMVSGLVYFASSTNLASGLERFTCQFLSCFGQLVDEGIGI